MLFPRGSRRAGAAAVALLLLVAVVSTQASDGDDLQAAEQKAIEAATESTSSTQPYLLQPLDASVTPVSLGNREKAVELIKEMSQTWEGMESPLAADQPWESVSSQGQEDARIGNGPVGRIGTPDDPFTPKFGAFHAPPRGAPPPKAYTTFLFDPQHPFRRFISSPAEQDNNRQVGNTWHPLHGLKGDDVAGMPQVVIPVPRPLPPPRNFEQDHLQRERRPEDWLYEPTPDRPRIVRPERLELGQKDGMTPPSYEYPEFHILNPRSAFTTHSPQQGRQLAQEALPIAKKPEAQMRFRELRDDGSEHFDQATRSFGYTTIHLDKNAQTDHHRVVDDLSSDHAALVETGSQGRIFRFRETVGDKTAEKAEVHAEVAEHKSLPVHYYPAGRHGAAALRGPPTVRRNWDTNEFAEAERRFGQRNVRDISVEDSLTKNARGPYGFGYNHQAGPHPDALPEHVLSDKSEAPEALKDDYRFTAGPSFEDSDEPTLPHEPQPYNHRFPLPAKNQIIKDDAMKKSDFPAVYPDEAGQAGTHAAGPSIQDQAATISGPAFVSVSSKTSTHIVMDAPKRASAAPLHALKRQVKESAARKASAPAPVLLSEKEGVKAAESSAPAAAPSPPASEGSMLEARLPDMGFIGETPPRKAAPTDLELKPCTAADEKCIMSATGPVAAPPTASLVEEGATTQSTARKSYSVRINAKTASDLRPTKPVMYRLPWKAHATEAPSRVFISSEDIENAESGSLLENQAATTASTTHHSVPWWERDDGLKENEARASTDITSPDKQRIELGIQKATAPNPLNLPDSIPHAPVLSHSMQPGSGEAARAPGLLELQSTRGAAPIGTLEPPGPNNKVNMIPHLELDKHGISHIAYTPEVEQLNAEPEFLTTHEEVSQSDMSPSFLAEQATAAQRVAVAASSEAAIPVPTNTRSAPVAPQAPVSHVLTGEALFQKLAAESPIGLMPTLGRTESVTSSGLPPIEVAV